MTSHASPVSGTNTSAPTPVKWCVEETVETITAAGVDPVVVALVREIGTKHILGEIRRNREEHQA